MPLELVDSALRGAAAASLTFNTALLLRVRPLSQGRISVAAFSLSVLAYLACSLPGAHWFASPAFAPVLGLCILGPALFWLAARAMFDDHFRWRAADAALLAAPLVLGYAAIGMRNGWIGASSAVGYTVSVSARIVSVAFVVSALWMALRHWRADLIDTRRRFRAWLVPAIGIYLLGVLAVELLLVFGTQSAWLSTLNVAGIAAFAFSAAWGLSAGRLERLFPEDAPPAPRELPEQSAAERRLHERLVEFVERKHAYRDEGLSIVNLASRLSTSEHTLRRLINQRLGYRNFNDFLHRYRVREACGRLEQEDAPVLNIALEVGYGSIGPFNRAFKQIMGKTPTEFRAGQRSRSALP